MKEGALQKFQSINIPVQVKSFLVKALVLFICWKLLYHLVLFPTRFPDKFLTHSTAVSTGVLYKFLSGDLTAVKDLSDIQNNYSFSVLFVAGKRAIGISDGCNGLELFILYIGFLVCIPAPLIKKMTYILLGIIGIYVLNTFRIAGVAWLNLHYIPAVDFAHHYLFKMIIYGLVFYTWMRFSKNAFADAS